MLYVICYHDGMIRTQIQLSEEQAKRLKQMAAAQGRSVADLIREGVDRLAGDDMASRRRERMKHVARSFGRFRSGRTDLTSRHDALFAEAVVRR
jgi:predicted DNA-binding protein